MPAARLASGVMKALYMLVRHLPTTDDELQVFSNPDIEVPLLNIEFDRLNTLTETILALRDGRRCDLTILSSHTQRATETVKSIAEALPDADRLIDRRLGNIGHRVWDGIPRPAVESTELYRRWLTEPAKATFDGGETLPDVANRIDEVIAGLDSRKDYLFVSHTTPLQVLACLLLGYPLERIWSLYFEPYSVSAVAGRALVRLNDASGRRFDAERLHE